MPKNRIKFSDNFVLNNDKIGINTSDPQALLDVNGDVKVSGIVTSQSLSVTGNANFGRIGVGTDPSSSALDIIGNGKFTGIVTASQFSTGINGDAINIHNSSITGPGEILIDPAPVGTNNGSVRVRGGLFVDGTTTSLNSVEIRDFKVSVASSVSSDFVLDGAGIGIGSTNIRKTFVWEYSTSSLKSSENINLGIGKTYKINGVDVLSSTTLGTGVTNSSLTSVGILNQLIVQGNVTPTTNNTYDLGSSSLRWNNVYVSRINATSIDSNINANIGIITTLSGTNLSYSGVSTFSNGPVLIGSATSTGTAAQPLQVTGSAYISGGIGIGTTNALEQIHSRTNATTNFIRIENSSSRRVYVGVNSSNDVEVNAADNSNLLFKTFGAERARFDINGNLGIGTTNPKRRIHIFGDATSNPFNLALSLTNTNVTGFGAYVGLNGTSITSGRDWRLVNNGNADTAGVGKFSIYDVLSAKDRFVIDSFGNVGVGTTNPTSSLTVSGNTLITGIATINNNLVVNTNTLYVDSVNNRVGILTNSPIQRFQVGTGSSVVTIDSLGEVGIGTTNPLVALDVVGNAKFTGVVTATSIVVNEIGITSASNQIGLIGAGFTTLTTITENQTVDSYPATRFLSSRYNISVACTGQLTGSYESPSSASVSNITGGQFYIPGTYYNIPLTAVSGVGTDARADITVNGSTATVGITSAYNILVTTSAHGLVGANQPVSFASSILRSEYVTLIENDTFYTPVAHGIGTSEAVSFGSSAFDSTYTGIAVTVGTTYFATGTGSTSFTIRYTSGGTQVTGIGNTTYASPGNRATLPGFAVTASTIYYATSIGSTAFRLASQPTGIGTVVGIAISTGLSIGATISGGVSSLQIVFPGSSYAVNNVVGLSTGTLLNSVVGTGFTCRIAGVNTNRQISDFTILSANSGIDYIENVSVATSAYLGSFDATSIGSTTSLRFSPYFNNVNIRFTRNSVS